MAKRRVRVHERATPAVDLTKRFPHLRGGSAGFRRLSAAKKLAYLRGDALSRANRSARWLSFEPAVPLRDQPFAVSIGPLLDDARREIALVRLDVILPSGARRVLDCQPRRAGKAGDPIVIPGFKTGTAGDLYASARIYYRNGRTASDCRLTSVLSTNPHQLVITPRTWLVSGRAGRVEYDWDKDEFHCRANATITNGTSGSIRYNRCSVRVTDGGAAGTLIDSFSFASGPFTVAAGGTAHRSIDTWFPKGSSVWNKFNARWDLTFKFTYESTSSTNVSDTAVYRPMSTVPINAIKCDDFTAAQTTAERDAVEIAAEILEDRDVTLYGPRWRILSRQADKDRYGEITVGWHDGNYDWDEAHDMYEDISGPESDRLDVFIPLGLDYTDDVPAEKRNVGGVSTVSGPFPKDDDPRRSGCLVLLDESDVNFFGVAIAHEICHYLGLEHVSADDNLMHKNGGLTGHELTWEQWNDIVQHGMMKWLAPDI